jgi:hypothetical protein
MNRSSEVDGVRVALAAMGFGLYLFWDGFKKLKLRRKMGDIPTSKISSAAVGSFVEIKGRVVCEEQDFVTAPVSNRKGVCFIWKVEESVKQGKSRKWVTVNYFYSCPFLYVKDTTEHLAAIDLAHCDFQEDIYHFTVGFDTRSFNLSETAQEILREYNLLDLSKSSFLNTKKYRIREKVFRRNDLLYIIGSALAPPLSETSTAILLENIKSGTRNKEINDEVRAIYQKAKVDSRFHEMYDKDGNSRLDEKESKQLHQDIQNKIFSDYKISPQNPYLEKCRIFFTMVEDHESVFSLKKVFVSLKSEQELSTRLMLRAGLGLIGGPLLFVFGLFTMLNIF